MSPYYGLSKGKIIKQQHFSSITHDSNSTDKLEDEGALILTPPPPSPTMLRFKATQKGEKSKQGCDFTEDRTPDIAH